MRISSDLHAEALRMQDVLTMRQMLQNAIRNENPAMMKLTGLNCECITAIEPEMALLASCRLQHRHRHPRRLHRHCCRRHCCRRRTKNIRVVLEVKQAVNKTMKKKIYSRDENDGYNATNK